MSKNFPLLNQIDENFLQETIEWNQNAFQTLLTSNLPRRTIFYYALNVGLRRLEQSLSETYWDATADALDDLTQFVFNENVQNEDQTYLIEGQCQLLMFSAVSMIKMNTIRRRSTHDAKMSCAAICSLLCQWNSNYSLDKTSDEFYSCRKSMFDRFLKRIFLIVQWLPTLSPNQLDDLRTNNERYIGAFLDQLFPAISLRDKVWSFIDQRLVNNSNGDDDVASKDFVVIRRFPIFNEKIREKQFETMKLGLKRFIDEFETNFERKLIVFIWTLCCLIESEMFNFELLTSHFSSKICSEEELLLFLLLCAEQNVHWMTGADSILHPFHLYLSSHLCTQQQKVWWQIAMENDSNPPKDFLDHLATIRLADERIHQHPPATILLQTSRLIFEFIQRRRTKDETIFSLKTLGELYFETAKKKVDQNLNESISGNKIDKLFFFFAQKTFPNEQNLIEQCEELLRELDVPLTPEIVVEEKQEESSPVHQPLDSTLFATPPAAIKYRDIDVQTSPEQIVQPLEDEEEEKPTEIVSPTIDLIFNHMTKLNDSIQQFFSQNQTIQDDIHLIRDRLEQVNRVTSQMLFSS